MHSTIRLQNTMALTRPLLRPSLLPISSTPSICHTCHRHESSYRRTRKALKIKPDPSFLPSTTETQDHIIFNPPSSAPNVYHTPRKFLPKDDPRRKLIHTLTTPTTKTPTPTPTASTATTASPQRGQSPRLPPAVRPPYTKKYHLTPAQVSEIRRLRAEDPRTWTRVKLAEQFECSQFFVSLCCCAPEIKEERERELAEVKRKWGRRKTEAREERKVRKGLWGRDG